MSVYDLMINLVLGILISLFVNWLADWLPVYGQSPSRLTTAHSRLRWLVVCGIGMLFGAFFYFFQGSPATLSAVGIAVVWFSFSLFLLILVMDVEHRRVLNVVVYPMLFVGVALAFVRPEISPWESLLGGAIGFGLFFLLFLLRPGGLGAGDVKLAALIGVLLGFPSVLVALIAAIGLGGIGAGLLLLSRRVGLRGTMAYAPYLSVGAMIGLLYGPALVTWYLQRLGIP